MPSYSTPEAVAGFLNIDDIAGRANPCILSVDTVRAVNERGYDAVFAE